MAGADVRIVRTRSIPNVDTDRLVGDLNRLHVMCHTPEGLHAHDGPRRDLVNQGIKILAIRRELDARHINSNIDCRWCG